jgi:hypothetical protein
LGILAFSQYGEAAKGVILRRAKTPFKGSKALCC